MTMYSRCVALLLLLAVTFLHHAQAQTCTTSWIESTGGSWFDAANWDNGVPGPTDDAYTVTVGDFTVNSLTLGATSDTQTLQTATGSVNDINIATSGVIGANGVLEWNNAVLESGMVANQIPVHITSSDVQGVDGSTALFRNEALMVHMDGVFQVAGGGRVENASVWDVQGDPAYNGATGTGTFVNEAGAVFQKTTGSGATLFTDESLVIDNAGTVSVESGEIDINRPFDHQAGALIQGTGIFDVSAATFTHSGDTGPGLSPGILTWEGTCAMGNTAVLHIEIVDDTGDGTGIPPCDYTILTFTGSFTGPFAQEILPPNATVIYPDDAEGVPGEVFIRADGLLPVELVSFDPVVNGETVRLCWTTASETNNAGFEVQRISKKEAPTAPDRWEDIGWVEGHGTTVEPQRYDFSDTALPYGTAILRYRLKQIDYDGTFDYSPEVEVALAVPTTFALSKNYPNPFNPQTRIRFALPHASDVHLVVYDVLGREITRLMDGMRSAGRHEIVFDATSLPPGIYIYRLQAGRFTQARHMLRVK